MKKRILLWYIPIMGIPLIFRDIDRGIPIEDIDLIERWHYFWYHVSRKYNLKRLEIIEKEIDNQLREEGLGD